MMPTAIMHLRTNTRGLYIALAAWVILAGSGPIWAGSVHRLTDADLVKYATLICEGRVTDIRCEWNAEHNQIHTIVTLSVKTLLKGRLTSKEKQTITLGLLGGRVGDVAMVVVDGPVFNKDEEVVLFLDRDRCPLLPIVGLNQGKLSIETDEKTKEEVVRGRKTAEGRAVSRDEFVANIQRLIRGEEPIIKGELVQEGGQIVTLQAPEFRLSDSLTDANKSPHESPPFMHWDLREFPACQVPWVMGTAPVPDLNANGVANEASDRTAAEQTFTTAFNKWYGVWPSRLNFRMFGPNPPLGNDRNRDNYNTLGFGPLPAGKSALTVLWASPSTGVIREADIVFNDFNDANDLRVWVLKAHGDALAWDWDFPPTGDFPGPGDKDWNGNGIEEHEKDLLNNALHEIGHFIGLDHCHPDDWCNEPNKPIMNSFDTFGTDLGPQYGGYANHTLKDADLDGVNFLYCPDLGDAPNKDNVKSIDFTTLVHGSGAGRVLNERQLPTPFAGPVHKFGIKSRQPERNFTYEWLGTNVNSECAVMGLDAYDDGVQFNPLQPLANMPLEITVNVQTAVDAYGNGHDYGASPLFVNLWVDATGSEGIPDGKWEEGERVINNAQLAGAGSVTETIQFPYTTEIVCLRARLDWGEGAGTSAVDPDLDLHEGAAQFGEVEDYRLRAVIDPEVRSPEPGSVPDPCVPDPNDPNDPNNDPCWPVPGGKMTLGPGQTTLIRLDNQYRPRSFKLLEVQFTGDGAEDIRVTGAAGHINGGGRSSVAKTFEAHFAGWTIYEFSFEPQPDRELLRITNTGTAPCTFTIWWMATCIQLGPFDYSQENKIVIEEMNMLYDGIMATVELDAVAFFHDSKYAVDAGFVPFEDDGTWEGQFTTENPDTCEPMLQGGWIWSCQPHDEGIWEGEKFRLSLTTEELAGGTYRLFMHDRLRQRWFEFFLEADGCILVDDFESYIEDLDLWAVWNDGAVNYTGSTIYLETDPIYVHDGAQAMAFLYKNAPEPHCSQADRMYLSGQDWTASGVEALSMWFYGSAYNDANEQMYVMLQDETGTTATVTYDGDANDLKGEEWNAWGIKVRDFADQNDVNLAAIAGLSIGFGEGKEPAGHGAGLVQFDDIRLCPRGCLAAADEWLTLGADADLVHDNIVNFKDYAIIAHQWLEKQLWP
ncbi:MAG: hypothetical protein ACYS29_10295 [Planctomycetota bacterium]